LLLLLFYLFLSLFCPGGARVFCVYSSFFSICTLYINVKSNNFESKVSSCKPFFGLNAIFKVWYFVLNYHEMNLKTTQVMSLCFLYARRLDNVIQRLNKVIHVLPSSVRISCMIRTPLFV
jgi:hypothetical protein